MTRLLRVKIFLGSTTEQIEKDMNKFLDKVCPGNYIEHRLYKHGGVYQLVLFYALYVGDFIPGDELGRPGKRE